VHREQSGHRTHARADWEGPVGLEGLKGWKGWEGEVRWSEAPTTTLNETAPPFVFQTHKGTVVSARGV
jgi:hypothetical protein